jgi:tetratricopeptide (TPR) repeat protein
MTVESFFFPAARDGVQTVALTRKKGEVAMTATLILAGALFAQSAAPAEPQAGQMEQADVAYQEMTHGQTDAAIASLRAKAGDDPAALINLGTAYARKGMRAEALACFNAAMNSDNRYELQLADGSWMDSRRAARMAAMRLEKAGSLSMR